MRRILLSIILLIANSGVALASNPFQTMTREVQVRDIGVRAIHANYTPRQSIRPNQQRIRSQPRFKPQIESVRRNVKPQYQRQIQHKPNNLKRRVQPRVKPQSRRAFNPNSRYAQASRAAKMGNPKAEFDLAMMYARGDGIRKDPRAAFNLFHRAARKGHVEAKYCMAINFEKGIGVIKQHELARHWYRIAAKAGHRQAQYKLALLNQNSHQAQFRNVRYSRR